MNEELTQFLQRPTKAYRLCRYDCVSWVAEWIEEMTGINPDTLTAGARLAVIRSELVSLFIAARLHGCGWRLVDDKPADGDIAVYYDGTSHEDLGIGIVRGCQILFFCKPGIGKREITGNEEVYRWDG